MFTRVLALALLATVAGSAVAADGAASRSTAHDSPANAAALQAEFDNTVKPYVGRYCTGCHGGASPSAQFDIKSYDSLDKVAADFPRWALVGERLHAKEMPPKPLAAPPQAETDRVTAWIEALRASEIQRLAGDPGIVLARRLSNAEYNYTIRDLTRQDMQLTRQFPVDPANPAGFDNSGESLVMSPALLNKYLQTARQIADHMVLTPDGIDFASHLVQVDSDRDRYAIGRILAFYKAQPTDFADYFEAAWRYRHRAALGMPKATLASVAAEMKISAKYLPMVWGILNERGAVGPVAKLQGMWNALPAPARGAPQPQAMRVQTAEMRDFVVRIRSRTAPQFDAPRVVGLPGQSQPLHNWRLRQYAASHRRSDPAALRNAGDPAPVLAEIPKFPRLHADATPRWRIVLAHARKDDADLVVPPLQRAQYEKAFDRFAEVFPDTFVVSERGRFWPDNSEDKGRFLSAGYHNSGGYYRDDAALMELILDKSGQQELDRLWAEFDAVASHTERTWTQWYFNNSGAVDSRGELFDAESGSPRPVGHEVTDTVVINQMRDKYLAKALADPANDKAAVDAIRHHFQSVDTVLRNLEKERKAAEPKHLAAVTRFAERAYRRPLTGAERADLAAYYQQLRTKNRLSHADAVRDSLVAVLVSPDFLYRLDLSPPSSPSRSAVVKASTGGGDQPFASEPLSPYSLASRLSYFLWSSMPDAELMQHAASGDITDPKVLQAQTRRMLKDPRMSGLATEFTGNWLGFRQFETNNSVDRERFPAFDDDLRQAMFQEPIRFVADTIARDGSVLDLLYGDYTFVNPPLARHYGMPEVAGDVNTWVRVDKADRYGRGGILPMAVFMTQNSPGLRTSPVKRGNWVVQKVLGVRVPPPPPSVPELPNDEAKTELPIREMLARHRSVPMCASCHARFDSFGLVFEGYGPVGGARTHDLAGRPVDTSATFPGGFEGKGMAGLHAYIREHRQDRYLDNISRKLLAFALNRSLQMSDEGLVDQMMARLAAGEHRFSALVETIVLSPQFRNRRVPEAHPVQQAQTKPVSPALTEAQLRGGD